MWGILSTSLWWDAETRSNMACGVPRTLTPCWSAGNDGSPLHTIASGSDLTTFAANNSHPLGSTPPRFHNCVLPWCTWILEWIHNSRCNMLWMSDTRSGLHTAFMSSWKANSLSCGVNWSCTATRAWCCPSANRASIKASPCSPPSPWCTSCTMPSSSCQRYVETDPQNCLTNGKADPRLPLSRDLGASPPEKRDRKLQSRQLTR